MMSTVSYLITMAGGMFWVFRVIVALLNSMQKDFAIQPLNPTIEIILLFVTLICLVLVVKRKLVGALIYFVSYGLYFGTDVYNQITAITSGQTEVTEYATLFVSILGVIIPLLTVLDIAINKDRKSASGNKKTDWFYGNEEYERKLDDRADKNQYKF